MAEAYLTEELGRVNTISDAPPIDKAVGGVSRLQPAENDDDYRLNAAAEEQKRLYKTNDRALDS